MPVELGMAKTKQTEHIGVATILIVDDEESILQICTDLAMELGLRVRTASTTERALEELDQYPVDIAITDLKVPQLGGLELLRRIREYHPQVSVLVLTQYGTIQTAVEATRLGAADYVTKPFHIDELSGKIQRLIREQELDQENRVLREQLRTRPGYGELIGISAKMQRVYKLIEKVSQHKYPVLILGESGTGKELVARSIHFSGARRQKPFVPVDCSALVPTLIESELFGYTRGAFTGAVNTKQGLIESADGGTLFLDEIGNLPVDMQAKLLRVLQEREVKPVGSNDRVPVHVRVIAATNKDLESAVRAGEFRQDLFFRLNVVPIHVPALREHKEDIVYLAKQFLPRFARKHGVRVRGISDKCLAMLEAHRWPGNVRELQNVIERGVILCGDAGILEPDHLGFALQTSGATDGAPTGGAPISATAGDSSPVAVAESGTVSLVEIEKRHILATLEKTRGNRTHAAKILEISIRTLRNKLHQYGVGGKDDADEQE